MAEVITEDEAIKLLVLKILHLNGVMAIDASTNILDYDVERLMPDSDTCEGNECQCEVSTIVVNRSGEMREVICNQSSSCNIITCPHRVPHLPKHSPNHPQCEEPHTRCYEKEMEVNCIPQKGQGG